MTARSRTLGYREWRDPEPDRIRVAVTVSAGPDARAFVTFTGYTSTWLPPDDAANLANWVRTCADVALAYNTGNEMRYVTVPGHGDDKRWWLPDIDMVLACGCTVTTEFLDDRNSNVVVTSPGPHLQEKSFDDDDD